MTFALIDALVLGLALAMDAFAVALTQGARFRPDLRRSLLLAAAFGVAQGVMPLIGWLIGDIAMQIVEQWDHWIAFGLLAFLGLKMIFAGSGEEEEAAEHLLTGTALLIAAIVTSIDALAAGITLPTLALPPPSTAAIIAVITFALSAAGVWLGRIAGDRFGRPAEVLGGLILIGLGVRILAEHTGYL